MAESDLIGPPSCVEITLATPTIEMDLLVPSATFETRAPTITLTVEEC